MFFEIDLTDGAIYKYTNRYSFRDYTQYLEAIKKIMSDATQGINIPENKEFTNDEIVSSNENRYIFWLLSIQKEIKKLNTIQIGTPEHTQAIFTLKNTIFKETINMMIQKRPRQEDKGIFTVVVYYELIDNKVVFLGSIFYSINEEIKELYFLSIFKSIVNRCVSCSESFSKAMLSYIESKGKEKNCKSLRTLPIGEMTNILVQNGFSSTNNSGYIGYIKQIGPAGGRKRKQNRKKTNRRKTNRRKTLRKKRIPTA